MSKVVRAVAGVAAIVVGAVVPGMQFLVPLGASLLIGALTAPKSPGRQAAVTTLQLGEQARIGILGTAMVGGSLADGFNYGGQHQTDWEVLPIILADHRCEALVGFYVGDRYVAFTGDGPVAGFGGKLVVTWHAGTPDQGADATLTSRGGWTAADTLAGICYVVVAYKTDAADEKNPVWPGGRPQFSWVVKGKRCYIPMKDSSVAGGSGPHRWNDPATWEWTDNLAVCRYNWVRGFYACDRVDQPGQLLIGRGLSAIEAPPERVAAHAALCGEIVQRADGSSEPRYAVSAVIESTEVFADIEAKFAAACAGTIIQPEGSIEVEPGHAKAPVAFFTDADLIVGLPVTFSEYRSESDAEWCNTVVARYNEPSQKWADHAAPVRRVLADLVTDRGARELPLQLDYVSSGTQAQRCAEIARRIGRLWRTASATLGPRFNELEEGDWIVWTSARRTHGQPVLFRIESYSSDEGWKTTVQLREISTSVFAYSAADEIAPGSVAVQQVAPDPSAYVNLPPVSAAIAMSFPIGLGITAANDGAITIGAHVRRYTDGHADVTVGGAILATGLAAGAFRAVYYDDADRQGGAVSYQLDADDLAARVSPAHPGRHYVGYAVIPTAGSPPVGGGGATPPGGYCVTVDTPLLMADGQEKVAGQIAVGDRLWTRHEDRLSSIGGGWGVFPVEAVEIVDSDDVWTAAIGGRPLRATGDHLVYTGQWVALRDVGSAVPGTYAVAKITVGGAHTYVSNGVLSHNIKSQTE